MSYLDNFREPSEREPVQSSGVGPVPRREPDFEVPTTRLAAPAEPATGALASARPSTGREVWGFIWRWALFYLVASFVSQIWAGSRFSPGQGGGIKELLAWSTLFGVVSVVVVVVAIRAGRNVEAGWAFAGAVIGHFVGAVAAIVYWTAVHPPGPGQWWVGPGFAAAGVLVSVAVSRRQNP